MNKIKIPVGLVEQIIKDGHKVKYNNGDLVFKQNSPLGQIIYIEYGLVKVFKESKNRRETITSLTGTGEFLTLLSHWHNQIHEFNAIAIEDTSLILIDPNVFKIILNNNIHYFDYILAFSGTHYMEVINRLIAINQKQLPGRVADLILFFCTLYGNSLSFIFPLNRKELTQFAGTTKESLIRTLTEFKNDRIINLNDRKVDINSLEIVKTLSRLG